MYSSTQQPAYGNYPPLPPQIQPMMMPLHQHLQFQQPNQHFYVNPHNQAVSWQCYHVCHFKLIGFYFHIMQQYVGQQNINAMHHNTANPNFPYQMRQMYNNYVGFNGNPPVMIQHPVSHQAPSAATMLMRPPPRIDPLDSLQASKSERNNVEWPRKRNFLKICFRFIYFFLLVKPPMTGILPPLTQQPMYMEPKMYARKSTRSSALKIVNPDTGEDVVENYRKEKETKSNVSSLLLLLKFLNFQINILVR
jgi:hypothetical protein